MVIGAQALIGSLTGAGVDVCFMNPGTSEMHFVGALDSVPQMRGVLALFEGVATGAADGYARIAGRPAAVLLHLGPAWPTDSPTCTTRAAPLLRCWSSWARTPPATSATTRRCSPTSSPSRVPCRAGCTPAAPPASWPRTRCARSRRPGPGRSPPWCCPPTSPGATGQPWLPLVPTHQQLRSTIVRYQRRLTLARPALPRCSCSAARHSPSAACGRPAGSAPLPGRGCSPRRSPRGSSAAPGCRPSTGWPTWPSWPKPSWPGSAT